MMKRLSILVFVLLCTVSAFAQHQRRVLIEEFTNASCPPCAAQNPGFNAVVDANIQYLTPVKYQTNWPGFDPMNVQTQADVAPRVTYYGVSGVPNGRQNGITEVFPLSNFTPAVIQQQYNLLTPVTINLTHSMNATFDSVFISVSVKSETELTGNLRLRVAVVEDEIIFESAPGTNGEKDFYQIMRKMLPNSAGTTTGNFAAGETKTYNFAWKLAYFYDINQMSVAAWLQNDGTKEVYQSERSEPLPPVPGLGISIPSENVFACAAGYSPKFTMTNTGDANLTSALIRYRQGTGAWTDLNWTGDLAPGSSEEVTLSDIVINTNGTVNVEVAVINSNLGIQTNLAGGSSIIKVTANVNAALALPFENTFQSAAFPPPGWSSINVGTNGWRLATNAGAASTRSARCNFYDMGDGQTAYLFTPKIDLSTATNTTTMTFDHAYAQYSDPSYIDHLGIEVSTDCGQTWESIFYVGGADLATAPPNANAFTPTAAQWADNELDMTAYNGQAEILIRFVGESGFGNNLYIDNVNVTTTVGTQTLTLSNFLVAPNPARDFAEVRFNLTNAQNVDLRVFNAKGALVQSQLLGNLVSGDHRVVLNAATLPSGSYRVVLQGSEGLAQTQMIVVK
jgi:hypothetical protein